MVCVQSEYERLITENVKMVYKIARDFIGKCFEYEDLVGYGMVGLVRAAKKYDATKGFAFSTFAYYYIKGSIQRAFRDSRYLRIDTVSLDSVSTENKDGDHLTLESLLQNDEEDYTCKIIDSMAVNQLLKLLDDRERTIITHAFELNGAEKMTQAELAELLGTNQVMIYRVQKKAMSKMRSAVIEWGCI